MTLDPGTVFAGGPQFSAQLVGSVNLQKCDFQLAGGNIYSTAWSRGGPLKLTMTDCTVEMAFNPAYGFVFSWLPSDTFSVSRSTFEGNRYWPLFVNYNGSTTQTWQWARDQGFLDSTNTINGTSWTAG